MRALVSLTICMIALAVCGPAQGQTNEVSTQEARHCSPGDIAAALQAFEVALTTIATSPTEVKMTGLGATPDCNFRFYIPEKPAPDSRWAFCEDEPFLGGVATLGPYKLAGVSRQFAIEFLDAYQWSVVWGPADGVLASRSLIQTSYRDGVDPELGNIIYRHDAFVTQEEPGTYLSRNTQTFFGVPTVTFDVLVDVVSHEEHLDRVENGTWRQWNDDAWGGTP